MPFNYDTLYKSTPQALGAPTGIFVDFFERLQHRKQSVLDVGCGQGRDALFIARLGHRVVGVDISAHGIKDLTAAAKAERLNIKGIQADLISFTPDRLFGIILIDRTLHMLSKQNRLSLLRRLLDHVDEQGWVLIADEASNIPDFADEIANHSLQWRTDFANGGYLFIQKQ